MNDLSGPVVLVVDDEAAVLALLHISLEQHGLSTVAAASAREAEQLFQVHLSSVKVLVTDVIMPEMSGIELAQRLLREQPELKVLLVSGYSDMYESALKGFECLPKPFGADELAAKVRSLLTQALRTAA